MAVLRGILKERETEQSAPWTVVSLDGQMASTDQNGAFIFRNIHMGKHRLSVRSPMYRPITQDVMVDSEIRNISLYVDRNTL